MYDFLLLVIITVLSSLYSVKLYFIVLTDLTKVPTGGGSNVSSRLRCYVNATALCEFIVLILRWQYIIYSYVK